MTNEKYSQMVSEACDKSNVLKDCVCAFLVGGGICVLGQALADLYWQVCSLQLTTAKTLSSITLVALSILLTGFNLYPKISKFAGAGTLVPITGFANACASAAIEFKTEGFVLGVGAKIFSIAGPVILYGTAAGVVYGLIYWITTLF